MNYYCCARQCNFFCVIFCSFVSSAAPAGTKVPYSAYNTSIVCQSTRSYWFFANVRGTHIIHISVVIVNQNSFFGMSYGTSRGPAIILIIIIRKISIQLRWPEHIMCVPPHDFICTYLTHICIIYTCLRLCYKLFIFAF